MNESNEIKSRLRALISFGGVEIIRIFLGVIKTKIAAILIGMSGIGLLGLFMNLFGITNTLFNLGVNRSAVKFISEDNQRSSSSDNNNSNSASILYLTSITLGVLGALFTFTFSNFLSTLTFGDESQSFNIKLLAIGILINPIYEISLAVLRGKYKTKKLLSLTLMTSIISLLITTIIFYIKGKDGIVYVIIIGSVTSSIVAAYLVRFNSTLNLKFSDLTEAVSKIKTYLKIGVSLTISTVLVMGVSYAVRIFLRKAGSIEEVGLYTAAFTIINGYFGMFFTSISNEYYPKLAQNSHEPEYYIPLMNYQSITLILILTPILIFFIFVNELFITLLYSIDFLAIGNMIVWAALGIYFKAMFYSLGVIFVSRGDSKYVLYTEISSNLALITFSIIGYNYFGFEGLGLAILFSNIIALAHTYTLVHSKYSFRYTWKALELSLLQLSLLILVVIINSFSKFNLLSLLITMISITFSWWKLKPYLKQNL